MITVDNAKPQTIINAYKNDFPSLIGYELYKWKVVKKF